MLEEKISSLRINEDIEFSPLRPISYPLFRVNCPKWCCGKAIPNRPSHDRKTFDMPCCIGIAREKVGNVRQSTSCYQPCSILWSCEESSSHGLEGWLVDMGNG